MMEIIESQLRRDVRCGIGVFNAAGAVPRSEIEKSFHVYYH